MSRFTDMVRFLLIGGMLLALVLATGLVSQSPRALQLLPSSLAELLDLESSELNEKIAALLEGEIIAPPPLRGSFDKQAGTLTSQGILSETNRHRTAEKLPPLAANDLLNKAAANKATDMIARQYFDHVAPDGTGPAEVVEGVGYEYLRVGENLAVGNFSSDAELVEAWMNSPGHRANILAAGFTELGVAVQQGTFEGKKTWFAVQTFALPASACSILDAALRNQFEQKKAAAEQLSKMLSAEQQKLEQEAAELKTLANEINRLREAGNSKIGEGNRKIEEGNTVYRDSGSRAQAQPYWDEGEQLQQEGRALLEEAASKQGAWQQQQEALRAAQQSYNQKIDEFNALNEELKRSTQELNAQIQRYNTCLAGYQK